MNIGLVIIHFIVETDVSRSLIYAYTPQYGAYRQLWLVENCRSMYYRPAHLGLGRYWPYIGCIRNGHIGPFSARV